MSCSTSVTVVHHRSFSRHWTHKASTVSLQRERSCAAFRIPFQVRCRDLSSFSADLRQVVLGLPRARFPSGVQNKPSLATSPNSFLNTCPIHLHFLRVKLTMMSSCLQMFRTSRYNYIVYFDLGLPFRAMHGAGYL